MTFVCISRFVVSHGVFCGLEQHKKQHAHTIITSYRPRLVLCSKTVTRLVLIVPRLLICRTTLDDLEVVSNNTTDGTDRIVQIEC